MPSMVRIPAILSALVLLLARCAVAEVNCSSTSIALPSVIIGPHVHFVTEDSADAVCMHEGFSEAGSARTSTLHVMGLSMSAVRVSTLQILRPRSTKIIVAVECLKVEQKACSADKDGSVGYHNKGRNNFGTMNDGDDSIGNSDVGHANWGNNNIGVGNRCFNKTGNRKVISECSLLEFRKYAWVLDSPPPPSKKA
ncbi:hypothetical protein ACKKBF_B40945 [Auxenochlorella protothecoides x Auxenochlorella symbiontica]